MQNIAIVWLIGWGSFIAIQDLKSYQITNLGLLCFLIVGYPLLLLIGIRIQLTRSGIFITLTILLLGILGWIGMGDAKLFAILIPILDLADWSRFFVVLLSISFAQIAFLSLRNSKLIERIAWAPAILGASALNMATQFSLI